MKTLLKEVAREAILKKAWFSIKHRPDSRGFDDITIEVFEKNLSKELKKIREELLSNTYKFTPLKGVPIKKDGGVRIRPLKIPAVRDRVVQKAIEIIITPHLKKKYNIDNVASFAYIKKRSVEDVVTKIKSLHKRGFLWIYKGDIERFFDTIDLDILLKKMIFPFLPDKTLKELITNALKIELGNDLILKKMGVYDEFPASGIGIPQGGTLSPLFANIYLNPLDIKMTKKGYNLIRYADDFVVLAKTKQELEEADKLAREIVEKKLGLKIYPTILTPPKKNEKKSFIIPFRDFEFLGIRFQGSHAYPSPKQFKKIAQKLKIQSKKSANINLIKSLNYLKVIIESWGANYHYTDFDKALYEALDLQLFECVRSIFFHCDYRSFKKINPQVSLNKVGLRTFSQSLNHYKSKIPEKRKKS